MIPEIKSFQIRDVEINPPLILSPMAGVTDVSFRRLIKRRGGVGLTVSEFISVEGLDAQQSEIEAPDAVLCGRAAVCSADFWWPA